MSAQIINLRRARKSKARREREQRAEENRLRHGLSKSERQRRDSENERAARQLDGAKLTGEESAPDAGET